jgi:methylenetetrahydrofolate--tRNA-(uracil-5-)-methyltransferase
MISTKPTDKVANNPTGKPIVHIVGAGLAGSECAFQLAELGYNVVLFEMRTAGKPETFTPAHRTADCAELVCSNSFGSLAKVSATGQLKWEAENLGSLILQMALDARVPAGQALGMDREIFARSITARLREHPRIKIDSRQINSLDEVPRPCVIASGPLTSDALAADLRKHFGNEFLYFFDAIAPVIDADSINTEIAWKGDRWDKGTKDYFNCPMNRDEYFAFIEAVNKAPKVEPKDFEKDTSYFDGCMPIEEMISRGPLTARFGPMKGKGLKDPRTGFEPFAAVQLRQDNREATAFNIVGFQTKMTYGAQKEVFRMIPGLENAEFLKLGSIHRNLYINSPRSLNRDLSSRYDDQLFFAGQITGVEGYFESTCIGLLVARFLDQKIRGAEFEAPPRYSAFGSLLNAITDETKIDHFQPTNINFGHMPPITKRMDKLLKRDLQIENARKAFRQWMFEKGYPMKAETQVEQASQAFGAFAVQV